ncbi:MAG: GreA/GreB family elongation factor [Myxococcales bacterium]|nr:GreA/GreB family elongation factor [Myxococcales bacterium]
MNKKAVIDAVVEKLAAEADGIKLSATKTREGATHEEARPENDKDTRATEASYLARGLAQRYEDLQEAIQRIKFMELKSFGADDEIQVSALVSVAVDGEAPQFRFLVPVAGGTEVCVRETLVRLVTPASPVGRALLGKRRGDDFVLRVAGRERDYEIIDVH